MPWFRVDDAFHGHPKVADISLEAVGLWALAGSWCAQYLTDGFVSDKTLNRLSGSETLAGELFEAGLWEHARGGWQFKDWTDYQPSKAEVEAEREAARERMKKVRAAKKGTKGSSEVQANNTGTFGRTSEEVRLAPPIPSLPNPPSSTKKERAATRGTRIPEPFMLTPEMRDWAETEVPEVDADRSTRKFVDYWRAESGVKATKVDWVATWRNWLRRDAENKKPNRLTPTERARQTAAAGRRVAGMNITSLDPKEITA